MLDRIPGSCTDVIDCPVVDLSILDFKDARSDRPDQAMVMRHEHDRVLELVEGEVKRLDRFQIQMIGRLVKNGNIAAFQHHPGEDKPGFFATTQHLEAGLFRHHSAP